MLVEGIGVLIDGSEGSEGCKRLSGGSDTTSGEKVGFGEDDEGDIGNGIWAGLVKPFGIAGCGRVMLAKRFSISLNVLSREASVPAVDDDLG